MKKKFFKTLLLTGLMIPCVFGLTACGGGGERTDCGEGNHTYSYFSPTDGIESMSSLAQEKGITKKNGVDYSVYLNNNAIRDITYNSDYDSIGEIYYFNKHYQMCTTCGDIKTEEHDFTASSEGATDTSHNVTCDDCNYTHQNSCNFKGSNQNEADSEDGTCFCGNIAPMYVAETITVDSVRLVVQESASGDVVIPSTYDGRAVTEVFFGEMQGDATSLSKNYTYNNITSITIPASVTKVYGLDNYTSAYGSETKTFPNLTTLNIEGVVNGADYFYDRIYLRDISNVLSSVNAPNCYMSVSGGINGIDTVNIKGGYVSFVDTLTVSDIENFSVNFVTTLNLTANITTISEGFSIRGVETINAPGLTRLETALSDKDSLKSFNAPKLEYIPDYAFWGCENLESFDFTNVKHFGEKCFFECNKLTEIIVNTTGPVEIKNLAFGNRNTPFEKISITTDSTIDINSAMTSCKKFEFFADTININFSIGATAMEELTLDGKLVNFNCFRPVGANLGTNFKKLNYNVENVGEGYLVGGFTDYPSVGVTYNIGAKVKELPNMNSYVYDSLAIPFSGVVFDSNCTLETIGSYAFMNMTATEFTIPDSVTTIEPYAFCNSKLQSLKHSASLEVKHSAVYGCQDYIYTEENGVLYFEGHTAVGVTDDAIGTITIKDGIKYIDSVVGYSYNSGSRYGFVPYSEENKNINIIIPNSVTEIVEGVSFKYISGITLSNGLKTIPDQLFRDCDTLTSIVIPEGVETIGKEAFYRTSLESISLPSTIKTIGEGAFNRCYILTSVTFAEGLEEIGNNAFQDTKLSELSLPNSLKEIKDNAFSNLTTLAKVNFGNGLEKIGEKAFIGCSSLNSVTLPVSLTTLGAEAFKNTGLTLVNILSNIEIINEGTFSDCANLVTVSLPNTLKTIDTNAFANCDKLTSITLPKTVETVGENAFGGCAILESINVLGDLLLNENVTTDSTLYKGQIIGDAYFKGTKLVGLVDNTKSFVYINEGTTEIAEGVFTGLTTLKCVYIPASVETIQNNEFSGCTNLTLAFADVPNPYKLTQMGATKYVTSDVLATKDGWIYTAADTTGLSQIAGYYGTETEITIPTNLGGSTKVSISGFEGNTNITKVVLGDNVVAISENAFKDCSNLTSITISAYVSLIGANAFRGCTALSTFNISGTDFSVYSASATPGYDSPVATVSISDTAAFATALKETYLSYMWIRNM